MDQMRRGFFSLVTLAAQRFCKILSVEPFTMDSVEPAYNGVQQVSTATEVQ